MRSVLTLTATLLVTLLVGGIENVTAAEEAAAAAEAEAKQDGGEGDAAATEEAKPEEPRVTYEVPEGGVDELLAFAKQLQSFQPKTIQEYLEHRKRSPEAMKAAAEKILELEKDESTEAYKTAKVMLLQARVAGLGMASAEERVNIMNDLVAALKDKAPADLTTNDLMMVMSAGQALEASGKSAAGAEAFDELSKVFAQSENEQLASYGSRMEGAARRMRLPGNPMELKGKLVDGSEFDWDSYRGKVVLVDFWASWCGPCIAELPNVKKNYALYHDRGFDVVGVSLDQNRQALETFLEKNPLKWATLFDDNSPGWQTPQATYYGINGIPTVILVDKEGKVASLSARGEQLGKLLEEHLGPVDEARRLEVEAELARDAEESAAREAEAKRAQEAEAAKASEEAAADTQ